jgi:Mycothiol maleylpyruvate isomerase N-terminal domain
MGSTGMDRDALLQREDEAWRVLAEAFDALPAERRSTEGVVPGWSTHDLVFHCVFWVNDAAEVLERMRDGDEDANGFDGPESEILQAGRALTWDEIVQRAADARSRVRTALEAFDDPPPRAIEWFRDETFDHYEEHAAEITAFAAG